MELERHGIYYVSDNGLGVMTQRGVDGGRVMMNAWAVTLGGVVEALTVCLARAMR
jgi:hypothetical protein